jgi:O-antigen/teichoic acid export membrane protein
MRRSLTGRLALSDVRSPLWIAAAGVYGGLTTYVLLVLTARAVGPNEYGVFSLFWSAFLVVGIGVFLPIEQVLARRRAGRSSAGGLLGAGIRVALICAGVGVAALATFELSAGDGSAVGALIAVTVGVVGFALQLPARGILSGRLDLRAYAIVTAVDNSVRTIGVVGFWSIGASQATPYMICVGASALFAGIVGIWLVRRGGDAARAQSGNATTVSIGREASGLIVALLCMQGLLNSPVLVAGAFGADAALPGSLMAIVAAARLPVFVTQAGQATYVGRIATAHHRHQHDVVRRLVILVAGVVGAMSVLTVLGAVALGPELVRLVFGSGYVVDRMTCALVAAGVGVYLIASVANDVSVAVGVHARAAVTWLLAAVAGIVPALVLNDVVLRCTLPLLVGSAVAAAAVAPRILRALKWTDSRVVETQASSQTTSL